MFERIWLRPRVLKNVRDINTKTNILGTDIPLPLFVSPTAMVKLAHPDGELTIARGCSHFGIPQTVSLHERCVVITSSSSHNERKRYRRMPPFPSSISPPHPTSPSSSSSTST